RRAGGGGDADRAPAERRGAGGADRGGEGAPGGGRAVRAARLPVRRHLRDRRRWVGIDQRLDGRRLRRCGGGAARGEARQSVDHVALRIGGRAGAIGREGGGFGGAVAAGAGRGGRLLPVRAA